MRAETTSLSLAADAPLPVHIAGLKEFLRWWRHETVGLLPAAWQDRLQSGVATAVSRLDGRWKAHTVSRGKLVVSGELAPAGAKPSGAAVRDANLWVLLAPAEAVVRDVVLPIAAEQALDEAIGFELDRLTPLPADKAWFGYRVTGRDEAEKQLRLRLAVAPRDIVERQISELRSGGARVLGVGLLEEYSGEGKALNLMPADQCDRPALAADVLATRAMAALAALLAVAALVYPIWLKRESAIGLLPRVDKAKAAAEVSSRLAGEIETLAKEHNFLLARKHAQAPMAHLVEELSKQLPDNTWVQQLELKPGSKNREVQIAGETGSSSALVEVLERSGLFANATFKSPLTKGATPNTERYVVAAELKVRDLPPPIPEESLTKAAPPAAPTAPTGGGTAQ